VVDSRNSAVTNLVNAGVPTHEAMVVSGHRTRSVLDRYSIRQNEQTRKALRQVSAFTTKAPRRSKVTVATPRQ
jgi:hypothetical protein